MEREEAVIADWSTRTASGCAASSSPVISVLLPEPATPDTAVSTPVGISTETSLRLCRLAFASAIEPVGGRTSPRVGAGRLRQRPVGVSAPRSPVTVPSNTISPP